MAGDGGLRPLRAAGGFRALARSLTLRAKTAASARPHTQGSRQGSGGGGGLIMRRPRNYLGLKGLTKTARLASSGGFRLAGFTVAQPVTLRLTSTRAPPAQPIGRQFKAAASALKRAQRLIRQTEALLRRAEHEATRRTLKPVRRSIHSSRAGLWRWYRARGLTWARFVADHGQP